MSNSERGFSIVEVLLSGALLAIYSTVFAGVLLYSEESTSDSLHRLSATALATQAIEVARDIREAGFSHLVDGTYGITVEADGYVLHSPPDVHEQLTRTLEIASHDEHTKQVTATVSWQERGYATRMISLITYFYNWVQSGMLAFIDTTVAEFSLGKRHSIYVDESHGSISLEKEGDWKTGFTFHTHDLPGSASLRALGADATYLYVGRDESVTSPELALLDIAALSEGILTPIAEYDIGHSIRSLAVATSTVFIATNTQNADMLLFDRATASTTPVDVPGSAGALAIAQHDGYVAVGKPTQVESEFFVYLETGELLGTVEVGDAVRAIALTDEYAYLATDNESELWIVDYKKCPELVCEVVRTYNPSDANNPNARAISVHTNQVFIGMDTNRVIGLSFEHPITPTSDVEELLNTDYGTSNITSLSYDDVHERLFIAQESSYGAEVRVVSLADYRTDSIDVENAYSPYAMIKTGRFLITGGAQGVLSVVSAGRGGWAEPVIVAKEDIVSADNAVHVEVVDSLAYVTRTDAGASMDIAVYEVSDPTTPLYLDGLNLSASVFDVVVVGDFAYLATSHNSEEIMVLYVKDPTNIIKVGYYNLDSGSDARAIGVVGTTLFVGTIQNTSSGLNYELHTLVPNTTNPSFVTFTQIGGYEVNEDVLGIDVQNTTLFLATDHNTSELTVLDATNHAVPTVTALVDIPGTLSATSVAVTDTAAYVGTNHASSEGDMHIVDISTITAPRYKGTYNIGEDVTGISVLFPTVFVATNNNAAGFAALTVASSTNPTIASTYNTAGDCNGVTTYHQMVFVACENNTAELLILAPKELEPLYAKEGWFTSRWYHTNKETVSIRSIAWEEMSIASTSVSLMVRYAPAHSPELFSPWYGPYTVGDGSATIPNALRAIGPNTLLQYRMLLMTDTASSTPIVESVHITYE